jgi:DNA polymerase III delta prime subunit
MSGGPDDQLQYRMCKKIAQLTKVIFHLNIRNEDSDARLAAAEARFQSRLEEAAAECAAKLKAANLALDDERRERMRLEAALQDLTKLFDKERAAAQKSLAEREKGFR